MGLMALLLELYQVPDLKLNLKFEIEVLAKTLKVFCALDSSSTTSGLTFPLGLSPFLCYSRPRRALDSIHPTLQVELADIRPSSRLACRHQDRVQTCDFANRAGVAAAGLGQGLGSGFGSAGLGGGLGSLCGAAGGGAIPGIAGSTSFDNMAASMQSAFAGHGQPPPPPGAPGGFGALTHAGPAIPSAQQAQVAQAADAERQRQAAQAQVSQLGVPLPSPSATLGTDDAQTVIPNLSSYLHINAGLQVEPLSARGARNSIETTVITPARCFVSSSRCSHNLNALCLSQSTEPSGRSFNRLSSARSRYRASQPAS